MNSNKKNQEANISNELLESVIDVALELGATYAPGPVSKAAALLSRHGKTLIDYWVIKNKKQEEIRVAEEDSQAGKNEDQESGVNVQDIAPFVVIGLGRCGCHVAAELAAIIEANQPKKDSEVLSTRDHKLRDNRSWLSNFLKPGVSGNQVFQFEPVMLIGDIDETSFLDVDGILEQEGVPQEIQKQFLKLNYQPLAEGGVGHVPIHAEFLTKSLLLLPGTKQEVDHPWETARGFLTTFATRVEKLPRLIFYIFSAGGGTGAGSAAEVMRAQSYAKIMAKINREMYFTGTAILPQEILSDQRKLLNTGRTIVQYLADLNIQLEDKDSYYDAPDCIAGSFVKFSESKEQIDQLEDLGAEEITDSNIEATNDVDNNDINDENLYSSEEELGEEPVLPWNGLAFISNDVMAASSSNPLGLGHVETKANQYIAQQMFNLAAAQVSTGEFSSIEGNIPAPQKKNYQAIRLDPNDLKTGLIGPYAICFGVSPSLSLDNKNITDSVDEMFLRAISLPTYNEYSSQVKSEVNLIEGISIAPWNREEYSEKITKLREMVRDGFSKDSFKDFNEIPFFEKCPRIIYSLTAPQEGEVLSTCKARLDDLTKWLFPNLLQTRSAISWGTTKFYSLSIYVETSVLLAPDIQTAIFNYLRLCWKQRHSSIDEFHEKYEEFLTKEPPIKTKDIADWLGVREEYGKNIPNFNTLSKDYNRKWIRYVEQHCKDDQELKKKLLRNRVENVLLTDAEVSAAIRYINYAYHTRKRETVMYDISRLGKKH